MKTLLSISALLAAALHAAEPKSTAPVVLELFTSEGCSSCPPADALLMKLDKMEGVSVIVLSEHVDYWNSLGWKDPYSSAQFTQRQSAYGRSLSSDNYTPQLVIDGRFEFVGSSERQILPAIAKAAARPKTAVKIVSAKREGNEAVIALSIEAGKGDIWIALADDHDQSSVRRGENSGRTLNHVAVVRNLTKVGTSSKSAPFEKTIRVPLASQNPEVRVVALVGDAGGTINGAAMERLQ